MPATPRRVYHFPHIDQAPAGTQIVKYMPLVRFQDLIERSALYFRRIDHFDDTFDGTVPLALWDIESPVIKQWYDSCKEELFVNCWNLDEAETPEMWRDYAGNYGVRIGSTVGDLTNELSHPPLPPVPIPPDMAAMAARTGAEVHVGEPPPQDAFTLGSIRYMDFATVDVHQLMSEGLSNSIPAFRKQSGYVSEHEFRAILRPGSVSGSAARSRGDIHVFVAVRLQSLIHEIRFSPVDDPALQTTIRNLLTTHGLTIPVHPSALGRTTA